jgi:hypothetical protein
MRLFLALAGILGAALALSGCTSNIWVHYDTCAAQTSSFVTMVECGKQKRNANCVWECSSAGNAFVQYADALAASVKNKEMSEAEAMRRFAEYKTGAIGALRRDQAIYSIGR